MNRFMFLLVLVCTMQTMHAQYVYTIKADSVKITNSCDTAELIIENHTQTVPGFLYNKGRGRTEFRRVMQGLNDTLVMIGPDTLRLPNAWVQGGNRWNTTGVFGTMDNNHVDFYTNGLPRARLLNNGNLQLGNNPIDYGDKLQIGNKGAVTINPNLSRSGDRIQIGGALNSDDGQNVLLRVSHNNGTQSNNILIERDGYIGIGMSDPPTNSWVGNPSIGVFPNGLINFITKYGTVMGVPGGPYNASGLATYVNNAVDEWVVGSGANHNKDNYYFFGTKLGAPDNGNVRASLKIGGQALQFCSGPDNRLDEGIEAFRVTADQHVLIGATQDNGNGAKLYLSGGFTQEGGERTTLGNGTGFDIYGNYSRMLSFKPLYYQSNYPGDQHVFRNDIAESFTGTLVTFNPGNYPNLPDGQLTLKVLTKLQDPALVVNMAGRVGIGTSGPTANLQANGTIRFPDLTNNNSLTHVLVSDASGNLYYREISLASNGTMNSDLAVNGSVSAQKVLISQTGRWPDYVFSKQYQLPSLTEVENFINQNNHLPGVPSAAEVQKKGIDVAGNQAVLLKKIEELTLYVIELEKKSQKQSEEIGELKKMIKKK